MILDDHIIRYEKAIRQHFKPTHGSHYGWTKIQDIKQIVEYSIPQSDKRDIEYFKALQKFTVDNGIKVPEPKK